MDGTVDLEGGDGSFVVIDVAGGAMRGVDVVTWPEDVRTVASLAPPATSKEGQVTFPDRRSQPGVFGRRGRQPRSPSTRRQGSVFHIRVGRQRAATVVRVADHMLVEVDKQFPDRRALAARGPALPERRGHGVVDERLERYVSELFAAEDPVLRKIRARHGEQKLPPINVSPEEGKLL
jgi:hypothetical protein